MINNIYKDELTNIIYENNNLILSLANRFSNYNQKEDLYQVGIIGLINAYKHFDKTRGCKFSTYAYTYILGEMKKYLRENHGFKISRDIIYLSSKIEKAKYLISQKLKRFPTASELANYLEMDEEKINEALQLNLYVKSLEEPVNDDGKEITLKDIYAKEMMVDNLDIIMLKEEINNLSEEHKRLFISRYLKDKTQTETADILGISQVQVSREEQKVLSKMRNKIKH